MIISKRRNQWPGSPSAPSPAARWLRSSSDIRAQQHYLGASLPFSYPTAFGKLQPPPTKSLFSSDRPFHTQTLASHKAASSVPPLHRTPKTTHGDSGSGGHNSHSNTSTATSPLMQSIWLVVGFFWWIIGFGCVWVFFLLGGGGLFSCLFLSFPYC